MRIAIDNNNAKIEADQEEVNTIYLALLQYENNLVKTLQDPSLEIEDRVFCHCELLKIAQLMQALTDDARKIMWLHKI